MVADHREKFGFSVQEAEQWKDHPHLLRGSSKLGVVLVHGWSAMPKQMLPFAQEINRQGHTVGLPLLSGHGTVPEDLENASAEHWINDVVRAIERLRADSSIKRVVVGGISMGGSLALLASQRAKTDGIILIGTPVHLKNHLWIWLGSKLVPHFKKYVKKNYPKKIVDNGSRLKETSYQYFPVSSVKHSLHAIRQATFSLNSISEPILILQTNEDYMVAKYSPWIIYNTVKSKVKKMHWVKTKASSHVPEYSEMKDSLSIINNFLDDINQGVSN